MLDLGAGESKAKTVEIVSPKPETPVVYKETSPLTEKSRKAYKKPGICAKTYLFCFGSGKRTMACFLLTLALISTLLIVTYMRLFTPGHAVIGNASNVRIHDNYAYAATGEECTITELETKEIVGTLKPPLPSTRIDDVSVDAVYGLLFTLDAVNGYISVFSLEELSAPNLLREPIKVDVGYFSGISARNGRVCVSGGTGNFSVVSYNPMLFEEVEEWVMVPHKDFPDVTMDVTGTIAFISTHFAGLLSASFGITVVAFQEQQDPFVIDAIILKELPTSNPPGAITPSNFPLVSVEAPELNLLVTVYRHGVVITDISDLMNMHNVATIDLNGGFGVGGAVLNSSAYVISIEPAKLTEIDLGTFRIASQELLQQEATDIDVNEHYITLAAAEHDLIILER